jgi:hypothetical protein
MNNSEWCMCPDCCKEREDEWQDLADSGKLTPRSIQVGDPPPAPALYEVGDEIELRVRVTSSGVWGAGYEGTILNGGREDLYFAQSDLDSGKLTPRSIQVGDRVRWASSLTVFGKVHAIRDGFHNVVWDDEPFSLDRWYEAHTLVRA